MVEEKETWDSKFELLAEERENIINLDKVTRLIGDKMEKTKVESEINALLENEDVCSKGRFLSFMECVWPTVANYYFEVEKEISASIQKATLSQANSPRLAKSSAKNTQNHKKVVNEGGKKKNKKEHKELAHESSVFPISTCSTVDTYCVDCSKSGKRKKPFKPTSKSKPKESKLKVMPELKSKTAIKSESNELTKTDSNRKIVQIEDTSGNITWEVVDTEVVPSNSSGSRGSSFHINSRGDSHSPSHHNLQNEDSVPILVEHDPGIHLYTDSPDSVPEFVRQALTDADTQIRQALSACFGKISKSFTTSYPRIRFTVNKSYQQIVHTIKCAYPNIKYSTQNSYDKVQGTVKSSYPKIRKVVNHSYLKRQTLSSCYRKFRQLYTQSAVHPRTGQIGGTNGVGSSQQKNQIQHSAQMAKALADANFDVSARLSGANAEISQALHNASKKVSIALGTANLEVLQSLKSASNKVSKALVKANSEVLEALASANDDLQKALALALNEALRTLENIKKELFKTLFDLHPSVLRKIVFAFDDLIKELELANLEILETLAKASTSVCEQISIAHAHYSESKVNVNYELSLHLAKANSQLLQVLITANSKVTDVLERNSEKVNQITSHFRGQFGNGGSNNNSNTAANNLISSSQSNATSSMSPESLEQKVWKVIEKGEPEIWKMSGNASFTIEAAVENTDNRLWKIADEADNNLRKTVEVVEQKLWSSIGASEWKLKNCAERMEAKVADVVSHLIETAWTAVTAYVKENLGRELFKEFCKQHAKSQLVNGNMNITSLKEQNNNKNGPKHSLSPDFQVKLPEIEGTGSVQVLVCYNNEYYVGFPDDSEDEGDGIDRNSILNVRPSEIDLAYKQSEILRQKMIGIKGLSSVPSGSASNSSSGTITTMPKVMIKEQGDSKNKTRIKKADGDGDDKEEDEDDDFALTLTACCGSLDLALDLRTQHSLASAQARNVLNSQKEQAESLEQQFKHLLQESQNLEKTLETELTQRPPSLRIPARSQPTKNHEPGQEIQSSIGKDSEMMKNFFQDTAEEPNFCDTDTEKKFEDTAKDPIENLPCEETAFNKDSNNEYSDPNQSYFFEGVGGGEFPKNLGINMATLPPSSIDELDSAQNQSCPKNGVMLPDTDPTAALNMFAAAKPPQSSSTTNEEFQSPSCHSSVFPPELGISATPDSTLQTIQDLSSMFRQNLQKLQESLCNKIGSNKGNNESEANPQGIKQENEGTSILETAQLIEECHKAWNIITSIYQQQQQQSPQTNHESNFNNNNNLFQQSFQSPQNFESVKLRPEETVTAADETTIWLKGNWMPSYPVVNNPPSRWSFPDSSSSTLDHISCHSPIMGENPAVNFFSCANLAAPTENLKYSTTRPGTRTNFQPAFPCQVQNFQMADSDPVFSNIEWQSVQLNNDLTSCPGTAFVSPDVTDHQQQQQQNYYYYYSDPTRQSWAEEVDTISDDEEKPGRETRSTEPEKNNKSQQPSTQASSQSSSATEIGTDLNNDTSSAKGQADISPAFSCESCASDTEVDENEMNPGKSAVKEESSTTDLDIVSLSISKVGENSRGKIKEEEQIHEDCKNGKEEDEEVKENNNNNKQEEEEQNDHPVKIQDEELNENNKPEDQQQYSIVKIPSATTIPLQLLNPPGDIEDKIEFNVEVKIKEEHESELEPIITEIESSLHLEADNNCENESSVLIEEIQGPPDENPQIKKMKRTLNNFKELGQIMFSEFSKKLVEQNCTVEFQDNGDEETSLSSDTSASTTSKLPEKLNQPESPPLSYLNPQKKIAIQNISDSLHTERVVHSRNSGDYNGNENCEQDNNNSSEIKFSSNRHRCARVRHRSVSKVRELLAKSRVVSAALGSAIRKKVKRKGQDYHHCCPFPFNAGRKRRSSEERAVERNKTSLRTSASSLSCHINARSFVRKRNREKMVDMQVSPFPSTVTACSPSPSLKTSTPIINPLSNSTSNNNNSCKNNSNIPVGRLKQNSCTVKKTMNSRVLSHHINLKSR